MGEDSQFGRRVLLVRHGQCLDNVAGVVSGQRDSSLIVVGHSQMVVAAQLLRGAGAAYLFASDSLAARMSARILGDALGLPVVLDADLREQSAGVLEGQPLSDVYWWRPARGGHQHDIPLGGGESVVDLHARVRRFFRTVAELPPGDVVVVTHGTWIQVAVAVLAGNGPYEIEWADVPNGSVRSCRVPPRGGRHPVPAAAYSWDFRSEHKPQA